LRAEFAFPISPDGRSAQQFQMRDSVSFGKRKVVSRVCVVDGNQDIRGFLREVLEELGLIVCECMQVRDLSAMLNTQLPDLVVLGQSLGGVEAGEALQMLAAQDFAGKALLLRPRDSLVNAVLRDLAEALGVAMLPILETPFTAEGVRNSVAPFLPPQQRSARQSMLPKHSARADSNSGINRRSMPKRWRSAASRRSFASAIRAGGWFRPLISYRMTGIPTFAASRNL
jgi:DNA-binding NtrC family response regulator